MKRGLAALAVGMAVAAVPGDAYAQGSVECEGALVGPVTANVVVPAGGDCRITDTTVTGNVWIKNGGGLIVQGSTINGNLRGSAPEYWGFTDSDDGNVTTINGNVELVETVSNPLTAGAGDTMSRFNFACEATVFNG